MFVHLSQVLLPEVSLETFSDPLLIAAHALTDALIGLSYLAISATLVYLVQRARRDIPFGSVLLAFGTFIVACGGGHLLHVAALYAPGPLSYSLLALVQGITVAASLVTAIMLPPLVPKVLSLLKSARLSEHRKQQLVAANEQLAAANTLLHEASESKTRFFANVSHELRTPLTLILGATERLLAFPESADATHVASAAIERNTRMLLRHVNDLLDVSKFDAGKLDLHYTEVDVGQLVGRMAAQFQGLADTRGIKLTVEAPCTVTAQLDADRVERVLTNLLANAIAFTPDAGEISCLVTTQPPAYNHDHAWASVSIGDTGPGVPEALRASVFKRFQQVDEPTPRRARGTGLGLAIVKEFVELHGGSVSLGESQAHGALVTILLPTHAPAGVTVNVSAPTGPDQQVLPYVVWLDQSHPPAESTELAATGDASQPLILVVEDDAEIARLVAEVLRSEYRVAIAGDGQTALEQAIVLRPDLILSDVMMPRLTGDQLLRAVRTKRELDGVPFVVLSAVADDALRVELLHDGAQDYVSKPFSGEELRARVSIHVQTKRARDIMQADLASSDQSLEVLAEEIGARKRQALEALEAREIFIAVAAHELKTPVTSLRAYAQLLSRMIGQTTADPLVMERAARTLDDQSGRLVRLVHTLLDSIGLDAGKVALNMQNTDLAELIRHAAQLAQATSSERIVTIVAPMELLACVDAVRMEQVVTNLLDNALKFSPPGAPVDVFLSQPELNAARIVVRDHGIGIPVDKQVRVLERFYQAHDIRHHVAGLGLGLHISQQIVELHGGRLELEAPSDGGTAAVVTLPLLLPTDKIGPTQQKPATELSRAGVH